MDEMKRANTRDNEEQIEDRSVSALVIAATIIAVARLARDENIQPFAPAYQRSGGQRGTREDDPRSSGGAMTTSRQLTSRVPWCGFARLPTQVSENPALLPDLDCLGVQRRQFVVSESARR